MAAGDPRMEIVDDLRFLRLDNSNLLAEVNSLRRQSTLLRERNNELERRVHEIAVQGPVNEALQVDPSPLNLGNKVFPDIPSESSPVARSKVTETHRAGAREALWFDDTPPPNGTQQPQIAENGIDDRRNQQTGPQLIGEAPKAPPNTVDKPPSCQDRPSTFAPPSPEPSHSEDLLRIALPSLLSVSPVSGAAVPDVASALLQLKLIHQETYDTPASIASFLQKLTQNTHSPQKTYRAAFTAAFLTLIPLLGPPGSLPSEWLSFLNDFPSRIPQTQRNSIVSLPWPESCVSVPGVSPSLLRPPTRPDNPYGLRRRSRSVDDIPSLTSPTPTTVDILRPPTRSSGPPVRAPSPATGIPRYERDAWVLLLALAYAAFPFSRVSSKMRRLPVAIKLQMVAWLPPGVNVYSNMHFVSTTVDEALEQFWAAKKEILRLQNGWE